jgi:CubicO group peptidase (beta-lactamase class C family)
MNARTAPVAVSLALALALAAGACGSSISEEVARDKQIDKDIAAVVATGVPGATLLVRDGGSTNKVASGVAETTTRAPLKVDDRFRIGSLAKTYVSVVVLQLVDEGKLELRVPIRRYLPDYAGAAADRVTIHQLLDHTSGLEQYDWVASYEEAVAKGMEVYQLPHTPAELLARYASGRLVREPGTAFDYNNADYLVLGAIVERATGLRYEEALARRLLAPLGLTATGVARAQAIVPRLAPTYMRADSAAPLQRDLPGYPENWWAAGAMYSTADDLLAFAHALYGGRLLRPATLRAMLTPGLDDYGYGLWIATQDVAGAKHRFAQRPGRIMGANVTLLRYLDDDVTVIVLGNTNVADIDAFGFFIGRTVIR